MQTDNVFGRCPSQTANVVGLDTFTRWRAFRSRHPLDENHVAADGTVADRERCGIFGGSIRGLRALEIGKLDDDDGAWLPGSFHRLNQTGARQIATAMSGNR